MSKNVAAIVLMSVAPLLLACGPKKSAPAPTPTINASMTQVMAPNAQTIWDITTRAFNAKGDGLEASRISDADWAQLQQAAQAMSERASALAQAQHVTVAAPGEQIMGEEASHEGVKKTWDAASPQQVQAAIDANPALFKDRARNLASSMDKLVKAARSKDVGTLYQVSSNLDEDCDSCHQPFWGTDEPPPAPYSK